MTSEIPSGTINTGVLTRCRPPPSSLLNKETQMPISNEEAADLVIRICEGYEPTDEEQRLLSELEELDLSFEPISSLKGLSGLVNLQSLDLDGTQVSSLEGLSGLVNLQSLDLSGTQVSSLEGLSGLVNLKSLDLDGTQVSSLEGLSGLVNLQSLWLNNTQVSSLEGLSGLVNLQSLNLPGTQVSSLEGISGLVNLQSLNLRGTQVSSLEGLSGLVNLQSLDLRGTQVSSLEGISGLKNLKILNISGTTLDAIPQWLVDRNLPFFTDEPYGIKSGVYMKDVQLSTQPASLFSQPRELIEAYYNEEQISVNEAKVIFLGDGGVGKTYTIYRIEHDGRAPESTETTPGVSITKYERPDKATINFWDFGGQEIMRSMHRCFLTERTCYVVTVSNRWSEVTRQARRWLKNIESFAPKSKVILAVNQWEGVSVWDLDRKRLKEEFSNLVDVVEYTATDSEDIGRLKQKIENEVDKLTSAKMKLPKSWAEIMRKLRNMPNNSGNSRNYITNDEYQEICKNAKLQAVGDISTWLLEWFNDLGVCFSYHKDAKTKETLKDYKILNPIWLTNAVYVIVNDGRSSARQGFINHERLSEILEQPKTCVVEGLKYDKNELNFILEVMRKFRLSFNGKNGQEFVPALCKNETPENLCPTKFKTRVQCKVRYDYLPDTVVHRLMVACVEDLNLDFSKCWLKGLCIDERVLCGLFAVCDMGKDDDVLSIDVYQVGVDEPKKPQAPQALLRDLLSKLEKINGELNLKSTTRICSKDGKKSFRLKYLLDALNKGKKDIPADVDGECFEYNIQELLGQVFDDASKIDISKLDEKERTRFFNELVQKNPQLLKRYQEELMKKAPTTVINNSTTVNNFGNGNSTNTSKGGVAVDSPSSNADSTMEVAPSEPGLSEQLAEFKTELNKLVKLNEDQSELLDEAIQKVVDCQNESKKEQEKSRNGFNRVVRIIDASDKALDVVSKVTEIAAKLGLTFLLG